MEFRVILFVLGFASSVFGELNGDQQNNFNYLPNEGQNQQGFGQNMYGNKISSTETMPAVNHGDLQKTRLPVATNGLSFPTPFYGHFQPMQPLQGSTPSEDISETQSASAPQLQKPSSTPETYSHIALPAPYPYPYPYPSFTPPPSTLAPYAPYGSNSLQGPKVIHPQNKNGNVLAKPGENTNSFSTPVTYTYPVPVPMPFPSYYPYPQMQYPH